MDNLDFFYKLYNHYTYIFVLHMFDISCLKACPAACVNCHMINRILHSLSC